MELAFKLTSAFGCEKIGSFVCRTVWVCERISAVLVDVNAEEQHAYRLAAFKHHRETELLVKHIH